MTKSHLESKLEKIPCGYNTTNAEIITMADLVSLTRMSFGSLSVLLSIHGCKQLKEFKSIGVYNGYEEEYYCDDVARAFGIGD
jgi:hypothetical protein